MNDPKLIRPHLANRELAATPADSTAQRPDAPSWIGLTHLGVLYVVWGSTYLAIRVAVGPGGGFPPFALGALRVGVAGVLLLALARVLRRKLSLSRREIGILALTGTMLWVGGNGLVVVAEMHADSAYAALMIGATPIWVAIIEAAVDRRRPSLRLGIALLGGLAGLAVLNGPTLAGGSGADAGSLVLLMSAGMLWGGGLVLQQRVPVTAPPFVAAAYQQIFAAVGFLALALAFGEPWPTPSGNAWLAWVYLTIFGSVVAFTSFVAALRILPASLVTTYAYVNPVIAMVLGALFLGEAVTSWRVAGAVMVLVAVAGVFQERTTPVVSAPRRAPAPS